MYIRKHLIVNSSTFAHTCTYMQKKCTSWKARNAFVNVCVSTLIITYLKVGLSHKSATKF